MKVNINGTEIGVLPDMHLTSHADERLNELLLALDGLTFTKKEEDKQWSPKGWKEIESGFDVLMSEIGYKIMKGVKVDHRTEILEYFKKEFNTYEEIMKREIK